VGHQGVCPLAPQQGKSCGGAHLRSARLRKARRSTEDIRDRLSFSGLGISGRRAPWIILVPSHEVPSVFCWLTAEPYPVYGGQKDCAISSCDTHAHSVFRRITYLMSTLHPGYQGAVFWAATRKHIIPRGHSFMTAASAVHRIPAICRDVVVLPSRSGGRPASLGGTDTR